MIHDIPPPGSSTVCGQDNEASATVQIMPSPVVERGLSITTSNASAVFPLARPGEGATFLAEPAKTVETHAPAYPKPAFCTSRRGTGKMLG